MYQEQKKNFFLRKIERKTFSEEKIIVLLNINDIYKFYYRVHFLSLLQKLVFYVFTLFRM